MFLAALASLVLVLPASADTISYRRSFVEHCVGAFAIGACTVTASSAIGAEVSGSATVTTSGETVSYVGSSVALPGSLGGRASVTSNVVNSTGPGVMVDALAQMVDLVTIDFAPWHGQAGSMVMYYTLEGFNDATGADEDITFGPHGVPYACVKIGIGEPVFPFGCAAHDQDRVDGLFLGGTFSFIYGKEFPLWFQLESIAGTGYGAGRPTGIGTSTVDFFNTATIAGFALFDPEGRPLDGTADIHSDLGITYSQSPVPEPATSGLLTVAALGWIARRARKRMR